MRWSWNKPALSGVIVETVKRCFPAMKMLYYDLGLRWSRVPSPRTRPRTFVGEEDVTKTHERKNSKMIEKRVNLSCFYSQLFQVSRLAAMFSHKVCPLCFRFTSGPGFSKLA